MELTYELLNVLSKDLGDSYYLLDSGIFRDNYFEMLNSFQRHYKNTKIAYSYKTNYIPKLCKIVDNSGGYAEIVSEMELWLALKIGVEPYNIYYNGPYKKRKYIEKLMLMGGHINIDANYEVSYIKEIAEEYKEQKFSVGIRCNIDIGQESASRFGFDVDSGALQCAVEALNSIDNIRVTGLHCHLPFRSLESFQKRMRHVRQILALFPGYNWEYISLGGGYMGKVNRNLAENFSFCPPDFEEYAAVVAGGMEEIFRGCENSPQLLIEPGSALVANAMQYVTKVIDIKQVRNKPIATLSGSSYQINPSVKEVNRPVSVFSKSLVGREYHDLDMAGYTCIESDYLCKGFHGRLACDDFVVFGNIGSYSIVMKPPFILPDIPVVEINGQKELEIVSREQKTEEIFERFDWK